MDVEQIDPHDADAFADWVRVLDASYAHDRDADAPHYLLGEERSRALRPAVDKRHRYLRMRDGHGPGAVARVDVPLRENLHALALTLGTHPESRRRGLGTALLDAIDALARAEGRGLELVQVDEPLSGRCPGRAFLETRGFTLGVAELRRDLQLPVPAGRLDALEADAL